MFLRLLPFPSFPHSVIHSFFSPHVTKNAVTTSRFTWFDWARHAQSIPVEVCEKLSNITLALTKRCECPDRANDTGHIRLNDNQHSSSPFIPAWHRITWVCGQACMCVWSVCLILKEWEKEVGKRGKKRWWWFDRELKKMKEQYENGGKSEEMQSERWVRPERERKGGKGWNKRGRDRLGAAAAS